MYPYSVLNHTYWGLVISLHASNKVSPSHPYVAHSQNYCHKFRNTQLYRMSLFVVALQFHFNGTEA